MPQVNWTINVSDLLIIAAAVFGAARWIVHSARGLVRRLDLHEEALSAAGWIRKDRFGALVVNPRLQK